MEKKILIIGPNEEVFGEPSDQVKGSPGASVQAFFMHRNMRRQGFDVAYKCLFSPTLLESESHLEQYDIVFVIFYNIALFEQHQKLYDRLRKSTGGRIVHYHDGNVWNPPEGFFNYFDLMIVLLEENYKRLRGSWRIPGSWRRVLSRLLGRGNRNLFIKTVCIPIGVDSEYLNIKQKSNVPTIIIDYDTRYIGKEEKLKAILGACRLVKKQRELKVVLLATEDPIADTCIVERINFTEFFKKLNESWIYATAIRSSYELSATEAQMAGNFVIGVENTLHKEHFVEGRTGFQVANNVELIAERILWIIDNFDPKIPRQFALEHYSWEAVIPRLMREIERLSELR